VTAYLDNSATTKPCRKAIEAMDSACLSFWGNPSSLHCAGLDAKRLVDTARKSAADMLCCEEKNIFFSPSGTAANNTAVLGSVNEKNKNLKKIVTTAFEHPSVSKCMDLLEEKGFEIIRLKPDRNGRICAEQFSDAIDERTALVSLMAVNNEIGTVLPFEEIRRIVKRKKSTALIHLDAVQAFGKIPIKSGCADLITASAHKIHGVKGAGLLYVANTVKLKSVLLGGGQENGLFSGTHNVPSISAFGAAIEESRDIQKNYEHVKGLNAYLRSSLSDIDGVCFNSPENALPYILNISLEGIPSQVSVTALSKAGVCVSAGSACSKGHRSETLVSVGLDSKRIDTALRISLSRYTEKEEIDLLCKSIGEITANIK